MIRNAIAAALVAFKFRKAIALGLLAVALTGCGPNTFGTFQKITDVATATVPANVVIPASNAYLVLKAGATRFAEYCIQQQMQPAVCEAGTRRVIVKAIRTGDNARIKLRASINDGAPAPVTVYNLLIGAVQDLQNSPANQTQFVGAK